MKKITFLFFLLAVSLGYAQIDSNYCSTDVFHNNNPVETPSAIKLTIENTGALSMKITAANEVDFLGFAGTITGNPGISSPDTSVPGEISLTLTWASAPTGDILFPFILWSKTSFGGNWQILNTTTPFLGVCAPPPTPEKDITLSDLKLDGVTIAGFNSSKKTYNIGVTLGGATPVVTLVTTTNPSATVGTITQASAVPGSATFVVTSSDLSVNQTYTINFTFFGPSAPAPTPPARAVADVISFYSDAYTDITIDNFDFGLCGIGIPAVREESISGNLIQHFLGAGCQGIDFQNNRVNASTFTNLHFDFYTTETNLIGKVFNIKLVDWAGNPTETGATGLEVNFNDGSGLVSGSWVQVDVNITAIGGRVAGNLTRSDIAQIHITSNLANAWYDNLYLYKGTPLSNSKFDVSNFSVYPNPSKSAWTVTTKNINMSSIKVYDILGKNVLSLAPNASEASINGSSLKAGLYFAQIKTANGVSSIKLVKE